jgi:hypothetical protein
MKLIYRGQIFTTKLPLIPSYRKPFAINWRYQVEGEQYQPDCLPRMIYHQPKAINWRWQTLA